MKRLVFLLAVAVAVSGCTMPEIGGSSSNPSKIAEEAAVQPDEIYSSSFYTRSDSDVSYSYSADDYSDNENISGYYSTSYFSSLTERELPTTVISEVRIYKNEKQARKELLDSSRTEFTVARVREREKTPYGNKLKVETVTGSRITMLRSISGNIVYTVITTSFTDFKDEEAEELRREMYEDLPDKYR